MVFHYAIREGETIQYWDVMSLYPFVCKYFKFPIGHLIIHVGDACRHKQAMLDKKCLIKCTVLTLRRLCHRVLPFRPKNKLFCLCKACVLECVRESKAQRFLTATLLAIQKVYKVFDIFEVMNTR